MKTTVRKPAAQRREEIANAVLRIIGERGLTSLTTATLAAEVGLTTGALFRHFPSLDEILIATVRQGVDRIDDTFPDKALPAIDFILALARNRVRILGADPGLAWLLRSDQAELNLPDEAVQLLRSVIRRTRRCLLGALREGVADGSIRGDVEPEILLVPILGTIHAVIGMPGTRSRVARGSRSKPERVLSALALLLAPPGGASRRIKRTNTAS
ncbi:hypothetical protein DRQ53_11745 [bacterium]|nr:MAG: hypothetical protein DRQ32_03040 [bacterium]RKZ14352.1 MAG: hypothetical protein DRQ53_11745 [bacterium]